MNFKVGSNYREVGEVTGLTGKGLEDYVFYMTARWKDEEETQCKVGYAGDWAERFLCGREWGASDLKGKRLLKEQLGYEDIDNEIEQWEQIALGLGLEEEQWLL